MKPEYGIRIIAHIFTGGWVGLGDRGNKQVCFVHKVLYVGTYGIGRVDR
jgi:hypothetical protein